VGDSFKNSSQKGLNFLGGGFARNLQENGGLLVPGTTNGDTLGEAMNLCKMVSKPKTFEERECCNA
jgi:hypothetical protein